MSSETAILNKIDFSNSLTIYNPLFPSEDVQKAISHKEQSVPALLSYLEYAIENAESIDDSYIGHLFALFILSELRETKAYPLIIKLTKLTEKCQDRLLGDFLTENLHQFLGSTFNGDIELIKTVIEDESINKYTRYACLKSLLIVLNEQLVEEKIIQEYTFLLFELFLDNKDYDGMSMLVNFSCDYTPSIFIEPIRTAFKNDLVDESWLDLEYIEDQIRRNEEAEYIHNPKFTPILDTMIEMGGLACFNRDDNQLDFESNKMLDDSLNYENLWSDDPTSPSTTVYTEPKVGRNDPCHCGSGKKFKKCCLSLH